MKNLWLGILFGIYLISLTAWGGEAWVPSLTDFAISDVAKDCDHYRTEAAKRSQQLQLTNVARKTLVNELKVKRFALEECARGLGVAVTGQEEQEVLVAQACPDKYEQWISPGYQVHMYDEDIEIASRELREIKEHLVGKCGGQRHLSGVMSGALGQ